MFPKRSGGCGAGCVCARPLLVLPVHRPDSFARMRIITRSQAEKRWVSRHASVGSHRPGGNSTAGSPGRCIEQRRAGLGRAGNRYEPPTGPATSRLWPRPFCPPAPERRPHHHHQGLAVHRREPPAPSPATELQGGRHLARADLSYPGSTSAAQFPAGENEGRGEGREGYLWILLKGTPGGLKAHLVSARPRG